MFRYIFIIWLIIPQLNAQRTLGVFVNDSLALNGYTLWTPNENTYLIDNCGHLINSWESAYDPGLSVYLLSNGHLLRTGRISGVFNGAGRGGIIEEFNWEGELIWEYELADNNFHQHHDIEPLPNGNVLVLAWEKKSGFESRENGSEIGDTYWSEALFEIEKSYPSGGKVVWEWHVWDHLVQEYDSSKMNFAPVSAHPELFDINYKAPQPGANTPDWLHFNSISYDKLRDEIIVSSRNTNEIYIIDHSTTREEAAGHSGGNKKRGGDILYRWGNPAAYKRGDREDQKLFGQHDARVIPDNYPMAGMISIFNNGAGRPLNTFSSIEVILPPRDSEGNYLIESDKAFAPLEAEWQYFSIPFDDFYSNNMGGVQPLPNGNFLVCESNTSFFTEISPEKDTVWHYRNPIGSGGPLSQGQTGGFGFTPSVFRATRYEPDFPGLAGKDLTPGPVLELDPIEEDCKIYGEGGHSSSDELYMDNFSFERVSGQEFIIKNPNRKHISIIVSDVRGYIFVSNRFNSELYRLNLYDLPQGIYFVSIAGQKKLLTQKLILF